MIRFDWLAQQSPHILTLFGWHLYLSVVPVLLGLLFVVPLGGLLHRCTGIKPLVLNLFGLLYTIPSLALFVLLPGMLGTKILDQINVVVALTLYALSLLVRTVCDGLDAVSPDTRQAAVALGYRPWQRFYKSNSPSPSRLSPPVCGWWWWRTSALSRLPPWWVRRSWVAYLPRVSNCIFLLPSSPASSCALRWRWMAWCWRWRAV
ncbi:hypothetical protein SODG_006158 [Sodalis praecaptivus]